MQLSRIPHSRLRTRKRRVQAGGRNHLESRRVPANGTGGTPEGAPLTRIGHGYDVHRLVDGRKLVIGGVPIPFGKGLLGHSDADVLLHAICDAVLGAAGLGDIGRHFPDSDQRYSGISSVMLLSEAGRLAAAKGFRVNNIDATIVAERPRMAPHIPLMTARIAETLGIDGAAVNVKATTTEGLGFTGRGEGIAAYAVCTLRAS